MAEFVGGNLGAAIAWAVSLLTASFAGWQVWVNHRAGVSGDERQATEQAAAERRDTIADRDSMIDQVTEDRDNWKRRALAAEASVLEWIAAVSGHVPWDWTASEIAHDAGRASELGVPPPLRPPPKPEA